MTCVDTFGFGLEVEHDAVARRLDNLLGILASDVTMAFVQGMAVTPRIIGYTPGNWPK